MAKKEITEKELIRKDIGKYSSLEAVKKSEGGQIILTSLKKDLVLAVENLSNKYQTLTHPELIGYCAKLAERLLIYRLIMRAPTNKAGAIAELEEILKDDPDMD